jgi:hypothetical protein
MFKLIFHLVWGNSWGSYKKGKSENGGGFFEYFGKKKIRITKKMQRPHGNFIAGFEPTLFE